MKPNHICKYSKCTLGEDGGRKHYYACNYCDASRSWKAVACCKEHYNLYVEEVLAARAAEMAIDTLPERTDKTKDEVKEIVNTPLDKAAEQTKEELKEYSDMIDEIGIPATVDNINKEIDKSVNKKSAKK